MIGAIGTATHCQQLVEAYVGFFMTGRVPAYPPRIHLQTQSRCNAACSICPYPYVNRGWVHGTMSETLFDRIVDELARAPKGTTLTVSLQNEPLLNRDTFDWFRRVKERAPQVHRVMTTNGALLHTFAPADIEAAELHLLAVSLNAHTRETYDLVNCGLDFEQVVGNILRLAQVAALRPLLRVDFVETEQNTRELDAARAFWADRGVATYIKPLSNRAGVLADYDLLVSQARREPVSRSEAFVKWLRHRLGCPQPFYEMSVLHSGEVIVCCHDWRHSRVVGNVGDTSIRAVWNSEAMRVIRQSLLSGNAHAIEPCARCSLA